MRRNDSIYNQGSRPTNAECWIFGGGLFGFAWGLISLMLSWLFEWGWEPWPFLVTVISGGIIIGLPYRCHRRGIAAERRYLYD